MTWIIKAMINSRKKMIFKKNNSDLNFHFFTQRALSGGLNDLKNNGTKNVSINFNLENVVETLRVLHKPSTSAEITFFRLNFCWNRWKGWVIFSNVGHICKICEKDDWLFTTHYLTNRDKENREKLISNFYHYSQLGLTTIESHTL